jgi:hypothetical protein
MDENIFDENGALSASFLLARGFCCGNGCRNCPYIPRHGGPESRTPDDAEMTTSPEALPEESSA